MKPTRILYVDDEADLRHIVRDQLTSMGYQIDEAEDGVAAMSQLQKNSYDVILLDINMPGKSGLDVLKYIKDSGLKSKIIMLTGRVGFSVATQSMKMGADEYITKPFNLEYLIGSITRVLEKEPQ